MRKSLFVLILVGAVVSAMAQVTTIPTPVTKGYAGEITIIFNPNEGNKGMVGATSCYAHTGLITEKSTSDSDWKYCVNSKWRDASTKTKMTKDNDGNWRLTIPNINTYYGCPTTEEIQKMAFVFNDGASGNKEGKAVGDKDIYVEIVDASKLSLTVKCSSNPYANAGEPLTFQCTTTKTANITVKRNDTIVATETSTTSWTYTEVMRLDTVSFSITAEELDQSNRVTKSYTIMGLPAPVEEARPAGVEVGIYYPTNSSVTLCTYAAHCVTPGDRSTIEHDQNVFLLGEVNGWKIKPKYQLKRDGNYFWITLTNQPAGVERAFQYAVVRGDGKMVNITDLYSEKVLHPDDQYEPKKVDPSLKSYPKGADGSYVSIYKAGEKSSYNWSEATLNFKRPDKNNLIIYEVWTYDYTPDRSFAGLKKRLDYIQNLGINCLELMPVTEFDGNYNWGYSPNHYFALDKAYGTPDDLKDLVDACHQRGIAVVLDMVFNHATGGNPMNKLYPYGEDLAYNPWFNVEPPHKDEDGGNTYYEDWNHDFAPTKDMFKKVLKYWLEEYKIDGYRMDLSHGFCGADKTTRYANLKEYQAVVNTTSPGAYFIQEYWGATPDKSVIINDGMICWTGNELNEKYAQCAMGYSSNSELSKANRDGYVAYNESHDEERNFYKAKEYGATTAIKTDSLVRLSRIAAVMGMNTLLNGSHMIYQYGEIGYDWSIDYNGRTGIKPRIEKLGWLDKGQPRMLQLQIVSKLIQLRTRLLPSVFAGNPTNQSLSNTFVKTVQWGGDVFVAANFDPSSTKTTTLPSGTWYDYLNGATKMTSSTITLKAGEIRAFTGTKIDAPVIPDSYDLLAAGIEEIYAQEWPTNEAVKILQDGQIYILKNNILYDLLGHRVMSK